VEPTETAQMNSLAEQCLKENGAYLGQLGHIIYDSEAACPSQCRQMTTMPAVSRRQYCRRSWPAALLLSGLGVGGEEEVLIHADRPDAFAHDVHPGLVIAEWHGRQSLVRVDRAPGSVHLMIGIRPF
jgi:hypothetical protein